MCRYDLQRKSLAGSRRGCYMLAAVEDAVCTCGYGVNKVISHRTLLGATTVLLLDQEHRIRECEEIE